MKKLLLVAVALTVVGCAKQYDADFYECETEDGTVLWTCVVDSGPPTQDCGEKSSGRTSTKPTLC